jgi:hypothetical protein
MIDVARLLDWLKAEPEDTELIRSLERAAVAYLSEPGGMYWGPRATISEPFVWRGGPIRLANQPHGPVEIERWSGDAWEPTDAVSLVTGRMVYVQGVRVNFGPVHLRATYEAGGEPDDYDPDVWDAPEDIQQAVRMLVAHWYLNREAVVVGTISQDIRLGVEAILRRHT